MACWKSDKPKDEDAIVNIGGPENVITLRSLADTRIPVSLGNKTWNVHSWTNAIKTSQYTWWNFVFLNLWQQVLVPANFYFVVMSVLQFIPAISDSGGMPTYIFPLTFVFVVTMIKDGWEDIKRHRADHEENSRLTEVLVGDGTFDLVKWSDLKPGDLCKVKADEPFPADLVMVCCSDDFGCAYVETVQLDGETNMKTKTAIPELHSRFARDTGLLAMSPMELSMGPPSAKLYTFSCAITVYPEGYNFASENAQLRQMLSRNRSSLFGSAGALPTAPSIIRPTPTSQPRISTPNSMGEAIGEQFSMSINQFLWRGATLVNTNWIIGVVCYPGHNSRILKNTRGRVAKYSGLMKSYNYNALSLFGAQIAICILAGILYAADVQKNQAHAWYLAPEGSKEYQTGAAGFGTAFAISFGRWILLMSYFIPITLLVQMEVCRWFHGLYINCDHEAYSSVTDSYPNVSTLAIIEDLGSVTHVFSDKTGTLTQNIMQLKSFAVSEHVFGFEDPPTRESTAETEVDQVERDWVRKQCQAIGRVKADRTVLNSPNRFVDFDAAQVRTTLLNDKNAHKSARDFLMVLSLCHSVLPKSLTPVEHILAPSPPDIRTPTMTPAVLEEPQTVPPKTKHTEASTNAPNSSLPLLEGATPCDPSFREDQTPPSLPPLPGAFESGVQNTALVASMQSSSLSMSPTPTARREWTLTASPSSQSSGGTSRYLSDIMRQNIKMSESPSASLESSMSSRPTKRWLEDDNQMFPSTRLPSVQNSAVRRPPPPPPPPRQIPLTSEEERRMRSWFSSDDDSSLSVDFTSDAPVWYSPVQTRAMREPEMRAEPPTSRRQSASSHNALRFRDLRPGALRDEKLPRGPRAFRTSGEHTAPLFDLEPRSRVQLGLAKWSGDVSANFDASSPDELALVAGAKHLGIEFLRRPDLNSIEVAILNANAQKLYLTSEEMKWIQQQTTQGQDLIPTITFEILEVLDFDNFRKRMSVIIRDRDGSYKLLCKGADSSMLSIAADGQKEQQQRFANNLADFAREGLRTLVLGVRTLSERDFDSFREALSKLRASGIDDTEAYAECFGQIEQNITLVGCTAIDDKLQDEVPATIQALKDAGVRVWVLTGDKVETAISIGHSCNLLSDTTYNAVIDGPTAQEVTQQMYQYMAFVVGGQLAKEAFDQILLQQSTTYDMTTSQLQAVTSEESPSSPDQTKRRCGGCRDAFRSVCCCKGSGSDADRRKKRIGNQRHTATMNLEDFVSILTFNAKHKKIVAPVDGKSEPKQLSPQEVEQLINVYVQRFEPQDDKKGLTRKFPQKLGELVGKKKDSPTKQIREPKFGTGDIDVSAVSPRDAERVEQFTSVAITITGDALHHALATDEARKYFFGLAHLCSTVIACRVTPKQKAEVVRQCGRCTPTSSFVSLGIGDGANDVGMILTANIGIGILGKEGSQAARSADISIGEFKKLRNLLFAHGHTILRRHAIMMYQTIYKNVLFAMSCYFTGFFSGFSAADIFDAYLKQFYNLVLTPWPICAVATFDRALPYHVLLRCASLYPIAMRPDGTQYFGARWFTAWFGFGIVAAGVLIFFSWGTLAFGAADDHSGRTAYDWSSYGQMTFFLVVLCAIIPSIPFTHTIFWFTPLAFLICVGFLYILWALLSMMSWSALEGSIQILHQNAYYHLIVLLAAITPMSLLFAWWRYRVLFHPTPPVIIRERIKKGVFDVVVAPRRRGELAVVVPRTHQRGVWKGFAYAPTETRFSLRRKSMSAVSFGSVEGPRPSGLDFIKEEA